MTRIFKAMFAVVTLAFLSACVYPTTTVEQGRGDAGLYFIGAPEGATAYVDGILAGPASEYDGSNQILGVIPGRHLIEVRSGGEILLNQEIYVGAESRTALTIQ